ncbi:copper resistance CopC family protein [Paraburkholderia ginsengisoli]|uniref:Copper resistance protein CopC n=1 Tax=Paraburkholderia ginsengisoli TaxID=311231 RepID=A0A7T4T9Q2_9BURK|nr:copper resistance protein CopC [Paraburkholderia ginsengisoli]QQC64610.1 copper resistance protein CopC [Paraburkholderia ginsengisoli]
MNDALKRTSLNARRLAAKLTTLAAGLMLASVAVAHVFPQKQEPGAGATVTSVTQVRVIFDGPLEPAFSSLTATDASGKQVNAQKASVDPHQPTTMSVPLPSLAAGHYAVHWVAVASDGHRTHGDYGFDVK